MLFLEKFCSDRNAVFIFLFLVTLGLYLPAMNGDLVYDDAVFLTRNVDVHTLKDPGALLFHSTTEGAGMPRDGLYQPLPSFFRAFLYSTFGTAAWPHHLVSILLHAGNACLLFLLLLELRFRNVPSALTALLFASHPVCTDAVAYAVNLDELLAANGMLFLFNFYIRYRNGSMKYGILSVLFFFLALLSKEISFMSIFGILAIEYFLYPAEGIRNKSVLVYSAALVFICCGFLLIRINILQIGALLQFNENDTSDPLIRMMTFFTLFPRYVGQCLFPIDQFVNRPSLMATAMGPLGIGGLMMLGAFVWIAYSSFKNKNYLFLGFTVFLLFLLPVSGIVPIFPTYQEHRLYMPLMGLLICLTGFLDHSAFRSSNLFLAALIVVVLAYGTKTISRNLQWKNAVTFYKHELLLRNGSSRASNELAMFLMEKGDYPSAINYLKAADYYDPLTHHNLSGIYLKLKQLPDAIAEDHIALQLQPNYLPSLENLYAIYEVLQDSARAAGMQNFINEVHQGKTPDRVAIHQLEKPDPKK